MTSTAALTLSKAATRTASYAELDQDYRQRFARSVARRLFPDTYQLLRTCEPSQRPGGPMLAKDIQATLRVIALHEKMHFADSVVGNVTIQLSALDGLYMACRGLAGEVMCKGKASRSCFDRLTSVWMTTMRLILAYAPMVNNRVLKERCLLEREHIEVLSEEVGNEHLTWPFWQTMEKCLDWCCQFHASGDSSCEYGAPRYGHLLAQISGDCLMRGLTPAIVGFSNSPCFLPNGALDGCLRPVQRSSSDHWFGMPSMSTDRLASRDTKGRPVATVAPTQVWREYTKTTVPPELHDGPPYGPRELLIRDNFGNSDSPSSSGSEDYDSLAPNAEDLTMEEGSLSMELDPYATNSPRADESDEEATVPEQRPEETTSLGDGENSLRLTPYRNRDSGLGGEDDEHRIESSDEDIYAPTIPVGDRRRSYVTSTSTSDARRRSSGTSIRSAEFADRDRSPPRVHGTTHSNARSAVVMRRSGNMHQRTAERRRAIYIWDDSNLVILSDTEDEY